MGISEAINIFEQRKVRMSQLLSQNSFSPERRHRIEGAVEEIDVFINTLRSLQIRNSGLDNLIPEEEPSFLDKISSRFKG